MKGVGFPRISCCCKLSLRGGKSFSLIVLKDGLAMKKKVVVGCQNMKGICPKVFDKVIAKWVVY